MTTELGLRRRPSFQTFWSLLTAQVGRGLVVDHARRQRAVERRSAAEQDVTGHGLVQHGAARAGVGRTLAVATHALVRQGPVQGAPG